MAHSAMVGMGSWPVLPLPATDGRKVASPPQFAYGNAPATSLRPGALANGRQQCSSLHRSHLQGSTPFGSHRLTSRRDLRSVTANSAQTRHFSTTFDPSKSNIPAEYNFVQPMLLQDATPADGKAENTGIVDMGPYVEFDPTITQPKNEYWRGPAPEGSFMVGNSYAQRTRLTPLRVPEPGATGPSNPLARILSPFSKEEYYAVEMDLNYGRDWPRIVWEDGRPALRAGFLQPFVDPDYPPYWLHRGIARFEISATDRVMQTFVSALYVAALAAVAAALYALKPALLVAVTVSWARNTLSLAKWAILLGLAATDRLFLYWVFLVAKTLDGVLERHMPPLRQFCWANFVLWCVYLAVSPADWTLLPGVLPVLG
ncbi:hypothetical protein PLESTM_000279700 [Pleodorina starrii]|nr:hypothetical protein PLESTM_000279700 [Pleodorina starrii]